MRSVVLFILLLFAIGTTNLLAQHRVMFSDNYPPYNFRNENGKLVGFNIEIIEAINHIYNAQISIEGGDWDIINETLNNGSAQAIGGAHYPGKPDNQYLYTRSTINTSHCIIYNTNFVKDLSLEKIRSADRPLIGLWNNDVLIHYILSINPTAKFVFANNYQSLIELADKKEVTCIFSQRVGIMYQASMLEKDYLRPLDHRILERNMGFKVSREHPELAEIINNGLEILMANGQYQQIYDKWVEKYNRTPENWRNYLKYILTLIIIVGAVFILLISLNRALQKRVKKKTIDLQQQLEVNSTIMAELEKQKEKAEESDKMKSAFLANMSHEIRTPMNGIIGFADLLESGTCSPEETAQFIDVIQKSGNRMLDTINNIIDVSKLESGLEKVRIKKVDIRSIMTELQNFFAPEAAKKGLLLTFEDQKPYGVQQFYSDEYKLNSILTNLIKNAIKFTDQGYIEISYATTTDKVEFWVKDTGMGIPANKIESVFDQFVQADLSHSRGYEGSGLGLSISKGYIDLLNGEINIESEEGKGTSFHISIPNQKQETDPANENTNTFDLNEPIVPSLKIIIAEDDDTSYLFLSRVLKDVCKQIHRAKDGEEAIQLAKEHPDTDIILMDIKMPKVNGFEATEAIRAFNKEVFIIAQTAYAQDSYKVKTQNSGCDVFITKPINRKKLLEIIYQRTNSFSLS